MVDKVDMQPADLARYSPSLRYAAEALLRVPLAPWATMPRVPAPDAADKAREDWR
jgi:hypothetical protein